MFALRPLSRRALPRTLARAFSTSAPPAAPLKLAVIGAGPSGFYAASRILQLLPDRSDVTVDMYERLPTPYGLVRYGVAPDHPEVKNCQHKFDELASDPRFTFLGNVNVVPSSPPEATAHLPSYAYPHALSLPLADLVPHYNAVLFAYGASLSNPLGLEGSGGVLGGVVPALALVSWYNGHPAYADLKVDLSGVKTVDVVGQGNVALDVARILLRDVSTLADSDIPQHVLDTLAASSVRTVRAVGRRGPGQVAFTTKELRELTTLGVNYPGVDADLMAAAQAAAKGDRMRTRMLTLMAKPVVADSEKTFELEFLRSPRALIGEKRVEAVEWNINTLEWAERDGKKVASAAPTGKTVTVPTDLVVESVGYRSSPLGDVPFDARGQITNTAGRVLGPDGPIRGLYAAGWVARGPVGVIASTMQDAYALADAVLTDHAAWDESGEGAGGAVAPPLTPEGGRPDAIVAGLKDGSVVDMAAWLKIDAAERERGQKTGRAEREKFARVEDMLAVL